MMTLSEYARKLAAQRLTKPQLDEALSAFTAQLGEPENTQHLRWRAIRITQAHADALLNPVHPVRTVHALWLISGQVDRLEPDPTNHNPLLCMNNTGGTAVAFAFSGTGIRATQMGTKDVYAEVFTASAMPANEPNMMNVIASVDQSRQVRLTELLKFIDMNARTLLTEAGQPATFSDFLRDDKEQLLSACVDWDTGIANTYGDPNLVFSTLTVDDLLDGQRNYTLFVGTEPNQPIAVLFEDGRFAVQAPLVFEEE